MFALAADDAATPHAATFRLKSRGRALRKYIIQGFGMPFSRHWLTAPLDKSTSRATAPVPPRASIIRLASASRCF